MDIVIGLLAVADAVLLAVLGVAHLERYERRHFLTEAEREAERKRRRAILDTWRH